MHIRESYILVPLCKLHLHHKPPSTIASHSDYPSYKMQSKAYQFINTIYLLNFTSYSEYHFNSSDTETKVHKKNYQTS